MNLQPLCTTTRSKWKTRLGYGLYAVALAFIAVAPLAFFLYTDLDEGTEPEARLVIDYLPPPPKPMAPNVTFGVMSVEVLDGHIFRVHLTNQEWHEVRLAAVTTEDAKAEVVEVLKRTHSPTVTLRRKFEGHWVADFNLILEDRRISLLEWLAERKLLLIR